MGEFAARAQAAAAEIAAAAARVDPDEAEALVAALASARAIVCHGLGREGLMMRALAMRLAHLGLDAHVLGDMTAPPVGPGDLLLVSCGPGALATVEVLVGIARGAGAATACVTAQPAGPVPLAADLVLVIPAQTMADDQGPVPQSILPMGSLFEGAQFVAFEMLVLMLRDRIGETAERMRARHTNLE